MNERNVDVVIFGAGIAGLWLFNRLKSMGYDALLLESRSIGGGQTVASQGIIHSGLKYAIAGQVNDLAKSISAMPDLWREALAGKGRVDLSAARMNASSQYLFIPSGFMGGLVKLVTQKALGGNVHEIKRDDWPEDVKNSGFKGSVIFMDEPVLDVPTILRALAEPYKDSIKMIDTPTDPIGFLERHNIKAQKIIYTAAGSNHPFAAAQQNNGGLKTQARPLLMGMMKNAPFEIYAHCVGTSDKPVATITTHRAKDGSLVWYLGGLIAERNKDSNPNDVYIAAKKAFQKYMPDIDSSHVEWAVLPIDRIEGKSDTQGWMPDTPTIHEAINSYYCWPTKLTFAPMLADMIIEKFDKACLKASGQTSDWGDLPDVDYSNAPWDEAVWTRI